MSSHRSRSDRPQVREHFSGPRRDNLRVRYAGIDHVGTAGEFCCGTGFRGANGEEGRERRAVVVPEEGQRAARLEEINRRSRVHQARVDEAGAFAAVQGAALQCSTMSQAMASAARIAPASAIPRSAMSNAVPWAGVAMGTGSPPSTVTPRSNPISFSAIWP